ncbi:MliC family protein [Deinococcus multiflagellatus]|uniref:MliC family protein n=1 Tax=Deinococcus multiflagellatus TaxID=1656887 RepID=A0ABW1ZF49_9DEIO|nr:MliC family protein [Deinococcus multiflagellatus]MBZ9712823.1 MliC family protein [Deinococcus multiflagellatus]
MKSLLALTALSLLTPALAATPPVQVTYRVLHYTCDGGKNLSVSYVNFGDQPMFAVLDWNGARYGLAQALSASGARYASLNGPAGARGGLQWWEHQGQATLSTFTGNSTVNTKTLLTGCKTPR